MNADWKNFLTGAGAVFDQDLVAHFGNPVRELKVTTTGSVIAPLSHYGIATVSGDDAESFLQGQLTNDVSMVSAARSQLSGYCNPQGRLLALLRLFRQDGRIVATMSSSLLDETIKRLRMFVLISKVTLEDSSDALIGIGLSGRQSHEQLAALFESVPEAVDDCVHHDSLTLVRIAGAQPRFEIFGPADRIIPLWGKLDVHAAPVGYGSWQYLDILAGLPQITRATSGQFIPQMLNLQLLNGLSFKKGCYTGQEIIARLHYRGKLKRRLYRTHIDLDDAPRPGDNLYADNEQAVGNIISAQPAADGGCECLAVVVIENAVNDQVHLNDAGGPCLQFRPLPYPVEDQ